MARNKPYKRPTSLDELTPDQRASMQQLGRPTFYPDRQLAHELAQRWLRSGLNNHTLAEGLRSRCDLGYEESQEIARAEQKIYRESLIRYRPMAPAPGLYVALAMIAAGLLLIAVMLAGGV